MKTEEILKAVTGQRDGIASLVSLLSKRLALALVAVVFLMRVVTGTTDASVATSAIWGIVVIVAAYCASEAIAKTATSIGAARLKKPDPP